MQLKKKPPDRVTMPLVPMIDAVFLLLIYFMVSATLRPQEAEVSFQLPGTVEQTEPVEMPDEQIIEINAEGQVIVNEYAYDSPDALRLIELQAMLRRYKEAAEANLSKAMVTVAPDDTVPHQLILRVMDACNAAGIEKVNFALGKE